MMERNRVTIQSLVRRIMDQYSNAFMLFHYEDISQWNWRFTYCHKSANKEESTDSKRYTFLLGPKQSCRTAAENFVKLYEKRDNLMLLDIEDAFSVEALSDRFFNEYKEIYANIIFYITGKRMVKKGNKWEEVNEGQACRKILDEFSEFDDPEKAVRDYVKKLMGRLVFLQFLQKKGWLGVSVNAEWGSGDSEFIQNLFAQTKDKDHFIDNVLEVLFNDLNTERESDLATLSFGGGRGRLPYLNGGLFERDATDEAEFPLPAEYMQSLLEFFSRYNFTIDENDPDDAEVGVDPEMLGRIFENLLEDNKDKGAFYTPKEIVTYMCRESLIAYLQTDIEDEATKEALRQFVTTHDVTTLGTNAKFRQQVDDALKDVKICDPAIGSGAFPMGLLKELFLCRTALESIEQNKAAEIKKHIIQQNIYGVDIEKGAVDIARLRFWLSLIVDEETPQALPNLDFKIMQGNSLLEQYKGVDLSNITELRQDKVGNYQTTMFDDVLDVLRLDLRKKLDEYYSCPDHKKKAILKKDIINNVKQQLKEQSINIDFGDLDLAGNDQFMLWHTWFYDVFSQGGFDIVIGNPPYIDSETMMKSMPDVRELYKNTYEIAKGNWDIYVVFFELGMKLLRNNGVLSYITPNKWISIGYGKAMRDFYYSNLFSLCDCQRIKVFEAGNEPVISFFLKQDINIINISRFEENYSCHLIQSIPKDRIGKENLGMCISDSFPLLANLMRQENILGDYIDVENPFSTSEAYELINLLKDENMKSSYKLINTGTIDPYINLWGKKVTSYLKGKYKYPTIDRNAFQIKFPKRVRQASVPKIIITGMRYFECFYDMSGNYVAGKSTIILLNPKDSKLFKVLLGILNSKLITFFIRGSYSTLGIGGGINFSRDMVESLPMPILLGNENDIISRVDTIIKSKSVNVDTDTSALETEIDCLVYQLYGLTYDEVLIVDPETPITREEYDSYK